MKKRFKFLQMKSIKTKLILSFSILLLLSSTALGGITLDVARNILIKQAEETIFSLVTDAAKLETSRLESEYHTLETLANLDEIKSMDWTMQLPILLISLKNSEFEELGIIKTDGITNLSSGNFIQLEESHPLLKAIDDNVNTIDFTISVETKELVLLQAVPIEKNGKVVGALFGRKDGNALSKLADDIGYGKSGYGYIINSSGTMIGHPNRDLVLNQFTPMEEAKKDVSLKSLAEAFQTILNEKQGVCSYEYDGNKIYASYSPIEGTDWTFVLAATEEEFLSAISRLEIAIFLVVGLVLLISIIITYFVGRSIAKPIIKTADYSMKIANLDLTENIDKKQLSMKDEVGLLSNSLQSIINNLRDIITDINDSSEQMAASSEELTATSQQTANAAQEVAKTIVEIAEGATEQAKYTESGSVQAVLLGRTIEKVQDYISNVNASTNKVTEVVGVGLNEIDNLSEITKESTLAVEEIYNVIMKTNESSNKIGEASSVIESIAAQTNLLSLNAAIEAARAGDAGKGFAVVAEEIRKLAEQSSSSTKVINEIVNELQSNTNSAVETMKKVATITDEQSESVSNNKEKYEIIAHSMKDSIEAMKILSTSGEEVDKMRLEILEVLQELSAIAEENAAASEQASASTQEQTASVEEMASSSDNLSILAQKLHNLVARFKL